MIAEQWAIYWWSVLENIQTFLIITGLILALVGPFIGALLCSDSDTAKCGGATIISSLVLGVLGIMIAVFIPSKQDMALMFAYPYMKAGVEQAAQSETVKKLTTISTKYLDKVIADLEKTNDHK